MRPSQPDQQYQLICSRLDSWREQFTNSSAFSDLSTVEQNSAGAIIQGFAECAFRYLNASPEDWNAEIVCECCSEILPRKVARGIWFFESIEPVLSLFFRFLAQSGLLPQGYSLAEAVESANVAAIINSENPFRWGPGKSFVMAARQAGIDLRDPEGLARWCNQMNVRRQEELN